MYSLTENPLGTKSRGSDGTGIICTGLSTEPLISGAGRSAILILIGCGANVTFSVCIC
jgi:hypothetical protein